MRITPLKLPHRKGRHKHPAVPLADFPDTPSRRVCTRRSRRVHIPPSRMNHPE